MASLNAKMLPVRVKTVVTAHADADIYAMTSDSLGQIQNILDRNAEESQRHTPILGLRCLTVTNCNDLRNHSLEEKFALREDHYKKKACRMENGRFMKVWEVPNTRRLLTDGLHKDDPVLARCDDKINEMYMFYSDKAEQIDRIVKEGFSICRKPVDFAESAQIADLDAGITSFIAMLTITLWFKKQYVE